MNARFQHFVITRFSIRARSAAGEDPPTPLRWVTAREPLDPVRLELRFRLFETFCLPSVLGQTDQDFTWIIVVDSALSASYRDRLQALAGAHRRMKVVAYDPPMDLAAARWLAPFIEPTTTHLVTTNLDDDDALFTGFTATIRNQLRERAADDRLPNFLILGCMNYLQWDLAPARSAPLGYCKPWHRAGFPSSAGYTLCGRYPEYDLSVQALMHSKTFYYFNPERMPRGPRGTQSLGALHRAAEAARDDWKLWSVERNFLAVRHDAPQALMGNHLENSEQGRVFEARADRKIVTGAADFRGFAVDLDAAGRTLELLGGHRGVLPGLIRRAIPRILSDSSIPLLERVKRLGSLFFSY
jgi:hypothetical protein